MPSRSQPVWQRSFSQPYIVCMSPLCAFPTTRTICRKLVMKCPRAVVAMWVPCVYNLKSVSSQEPQVAGLAVGHRDPHTPNGFASVALGFTLRKLFTPSCVYRICCRGLPPRCARRCIHQGWSHLPRQGKTRDTLPTPQRSDPSRVAESSRVIGSSSPTLDPWVPHHALRGG